MTCPEELTRQGSENRVEPGSPLSPSHVHDLCASQPSRRIATRRPSPSDGNDSDELEMDGDFPVTPISPADSAAFPPPTSHRLSIQTQTPSQRQNQKQKRISRDRKVGFEMSPRKTIFRYIPPDEDELPGWDSVSGDEESSNSASGDESEDAQWWWDGWEEHHEDDEVIHAQQPEMSMNMDLDMDMDEEGKDQVIIITKQSDDDVYACVERPSRPRVRVQRAFTL